MNKLVQAYQNSNKNQEITALELACTINYRAVLSYAKARKNFLNLFTQTLASSLAIFWASGFRFKHLCGLENSFFAGIEERAHTMIRGSKGKCDHCFDFLIFGVLENDRLIAKQIRYEEYRSCGLHFEEFQHEGDPAYSVPVYDDYCNLGLNEDPWSRENKGQREVNNLCVLTLSSELASHLHQFESNLCNHPYRLNPDIKVIADCFFDQENTISRCSALHRLLSIYR